MQTMTVRVPVELLARLNRETGPRGRSAFVRRAIERALNGRDAKGTKILESRRNAIAHKA